LIPSRDREVILFSTAFTYETHPIPYPVGTGCSFPGDKAAGA